MFDLFNDSRKNQNNMFMGGFGGPFSSPMGNPKDYTKSNAFDTIFAYLLKVFICCSFAVLFFGEYVSEWLSSMTMDKAKILVIILKVGIYGIILLFMRSSFVSIKENRFKMGMFYGLNEKLYNTLKILIGMVFGFYFVYKKDIDTSISLLDFNMADFFEKLVCMMIVSTVIYICICILGKILIALPDIINNKKEMQKTNDTPYGFTDNLDNGLAFSNNNLSGMPFGKMNGYFNNDEEKEEFDFEEEIDDKE